MKKFIKEYLTYLMSVTILLTSMPFGVLAAGVPVEVKVGGFPTIEYVATINAPINISLNKSNKGQAYVYVNNNSNTYLKAKLSDITLVTESGPSNFVAPDSKDWASLSAEDTQKYIAFEIFGSKYTVKDVQSNTTKVYQKRGVIYPAATENYVGVDLGVLSFDPGVDGEFTGVPTSTFYEYDMLADKKIYTLEATVGYRWEVETTLTYNITILTELLGNKDESYIGYNSAEDFNTDYLNIKMSSGGYNPQVSLADTNEATIFYGDLYITTNTPWKGITPAGTESDYANIKSNYYIEYSWSADFGSEHKDAAFGLSSSKNHAGAAVYTYYSTLTREHNSEPGEGVSSVLDYDVVKTYTDGQQAYVPYTVTITHTASGNENNTIEKEYTFEDVMIVDFKKNA